MTRRPRPLQDIATEVIRFQALWVGAGTAMLSGGFITLATSEAITASIGLVPGALAVLATILAAGRVADVGEQLVTPLSDPQDDHGHPLVPAPPSPIVPPPRKGTPLWP